MANPIAEAIGPFIWGAGGSKKTPEEIARDKEVAAAILMKAGNTSPVDHWTQGAARVVDALGGVLKQRRAEAAGVENATYNEGILQNILGGGQSAPAAAQSSTIPMTGAAGEAAATSPMGGNQSYRDAIASIESKGSGDYAAVGPTHPKMGRALGRYQIMESNIGPWSKQALGREVTPEEFMANPQIQDAIFDNQFNGYVQKYGPEGAAQAWLGGPGGVGKTDRQDSLGTSVGEYGQRFVNALGPQEVASLSPSAPTTAAQAIEAQAPALPEPQTIAPAPAVAGQPIEVAGGGGRPSYFEQPQAAPQAVPGMNEALVRAITDPRANEQTKAIAQALMQQQMAQQQAEREMRLKQADPAYRLGIEKSQLEIDNLRNPRMSNADKLAREKFDLEKGQQGKTADINEYEYAQQRGYKGSFTDFMLDQKKAGASNTVINNGEGNKFYNTLDEKNATTISGLSETGMQARAKMGQIDQLEKLMSASPTGPVAVLKQAAGEYGINTEGLSDIQAATAMLNQLVPQQRAPGSGSMSDADLALFKQSLPRLINQPGGNQTILNTMRGITQYQIQTGEIADRIANREITPAEGRAAIAQLPNPLSNFKPPAAGKEEEGWREYSPGVRARKVK